MRLPRPVALVLSVVALIFAAAPRVPAQSPPLRMEWTAGDEAGKIAQVPDVKWLEDGTAILYDMRKPEAQRTLEKLDPATGQRTPILNMSQALASLKGMAKPADLEDAKIKEALPWPAVLDDKGQRAVYEIGGEIYLLDLPSSAFTRVTNTADEEKDAQLSPDASKIAFVRKNDIYVYDIPTKKENRLTRDGSATILNGTLSWVYWEEIAGRHDTGLWWSPDSRSIAYLQTDESPVTISTFVDPAPVDEKVIQQRYPKPGETNPKVRVGVVQVGANPQTRWISITDKPYEWTLRVKWLPDSQRLSVQTLNRQQTEEGLYFVDTKTGASKRVLTETDPYWVNVSDDLYFLKDGKHFLWGSERDGFMHLYRFAMDGTLVNKITEGDWATASSGGNVFWVRQAVTGIDEKNDWIYFTALKDGSVDRNLYRIHSDGSGIERLSAESGTHRIAMSPDTRFYFDTYSNIKTLPALRLHTSDGKLQSVIAAPRPELLPADMQYAELLTVPSSDGFRMPAQILRPKNFDPATKYPVILHIYGGPSAPSVTNSWQAVTLFDNVMAADGYVMIAIDNRAATGISKKLENTLGENPSASETADLVDGIRWFKQQPWVDPDRVGVYGWSGGGTNTLNVMTRSKEFKAGIAGAPVTDWHYYDSKWAEALVKMPQDRPQLYDSTSLVKRAADLHGHLMMIFGTYDDNVHPQNEQMFMNQLIKAGILFETSIYPMRKHGFTDTPAKIHRDKTMEDFWKRNL
ncbi:MAG: S9 family peptidase [Terriglobales bacterium]